MENKNEKNQKIGLSSDLKELSELIKDERRTKKIKKDVTSSRLLGMLGYLSKDEHRYVPKKINTIGELYAFSEYEILHKFRFYKKKTWLRLNEVLGTYGLPALNLPQEYTSDPLSS